MHSHPWCGVYMLAINSPAERAVKIHISTSKQLQLFLQAAKLFVLLHAVHRACMPFSHGRLHCTVKICTRRVRMQAWNNCIRVDIGVEWIIAEVIDWLVDWLVDWLTDWSSGDCGEGKHPSMQLPSSSLPSIDLAAETDKNSCYTTIVLVVT